ncbi:hypothetical protein ACF0H5_013739 [Mactra antiquata]
MEPLVYPQSEGMFPSDDEANEDVIALRRQYWKLEQARKYITSRNEGQNTDHDEVNTRPVTCLLNPGLTPSILYDHLKSRGASDSCILEWTRRLQTLRKDADKTTHVQL